MLNNNKLTTSNQTIFFFAFIILYFLSCVPATVQFTQLPRQEKNSKKFSESTKIKGSLSVKDTLVVQTYEHILLIPIFSFFLLLSLELLFFQMYPMICARVSSTFTVCIFLFDWIKFGNIDINVTAINRKLVYYICFSTEEF